MKKLKKKRPKLNVINDYLLETTKKFEESKTERTLNSILYGLYWSDNEILYGGPEKFLLLEQTKLWQLISKKI